jgi:hypothetical protein
MWHSDLIGIKNDPVAVVDKLESILAELAAENNAENAARTMATIMTSPALNATDLPVCNAPSFDQFYQQYGPWILNNTLGKKTIKSYTNAECQAGLVDR